MPRGTWRSVATAVLRSVSAPSADMRPRPMRPGSAPRWGSRTGCSASSWRRCPVASAVGSSWLASCSPAPVTATPPCCSTSPPTTSTPTRSSGCVSSCAPTAAGSWWSATMSICWTAASTRFSTSTPPAPRWMSTTSTGRPTWLSGSLTSAVGGGSGPTPRRRSMP